MKTTTILQSIVVFMTVSFVLFINQEAKAQKWGWGNGIVGEGPIVTKTIDLPTITGVGLGFSGDIHIKQGSTQSITIKGQQNIIDNIKTRVSGNTWEVEFDKDVKKHDPIHVYITVKNLKDLAIGGSGTIEGDGKFTNLDDLDLSIGGSGDIIMDIEARDINASIAGSGSIKLCGSGDALDISIAGSGDVYAGDLKVNNCEVSIAGSGDSQVNVTNSLEVSTVGSGDVRYYGNPSVETSMMGSGSVRPMKNN